MENLGCGSVGYGKFMITQIPILNLIRDPHSTATGTVLQAASKYHSNQYLWRE